jgi:cbb3-type cytochrome oxidase subunit 3
MSSLGTLALFLFALALLIFIYSWFRSNKG